MPANFIQTRWQKSTACPASFWPKSSPPPSLRHWRQTETENGSETESETELVDQQTLASVCGHWRDVIASSPQCWSTVRAEDGRSAWITALRMSRNALIDIRFDGNACPEDVGPSEEAEGFLGRVAKESHRWRSFHFGDKNLVESYEDRYAEDLVRTLGHQPPFSSISSSSRIPVHSSLPHYSFLSSRPSDTLHWSTLISTGTNVHSRISKHSH